MELYCSEVKQRDCGPRAMADPALLDDPRVLERLLATEDKYTRSCAYLTCGQSDIQPRMRKALATWMLEVCEEQACDDVVFPLAMTYVDRFLSEVRIGKHQLQLLGAVCLLLASKLRQCRHIAPETLVYYTDYSVTQRDITNWELLVLSRLQWDVSSVVPNDFVDHLMARLLKDVNRGLGSHHIATVRRHATTFIALCATEHKFSSYAPSLLATSSVAAAANGLNWLRKPWSSLNHLLTMLQQITGIEADCIRYCVEEIEELMSVNMKLLLQTTVKTQTSSSNGSKINYTTSTNPNSSHPETPTDVQDIYF